MFGKSETKRRSPQPPKTPDAIRDTGQEGQQIPKYVEAWGAFAAMARFRGVVLLICSVTLLLSAGLNVMLLLSQNTIVVGITETGKPEILLPSQAKIDLQVFAKEFGMNYLSYSPTTIDQNIKSAMLLASPGFIEAFNATLGKKFIDSVKTEQITQLISFSEVSISNLSDRGFKATLKGMRYRSILQSTNEERVTFEMEVLRGPVTVQNPWGYYVQALREMANPQRN